MSEAGKVMQYNRSSDEMVAACLPAKVNVKCPANNALKHRPADFAQANGLMCKACHMTMGKDKDPMANATTFVLKFGELMSSNATTVQGVNNYEVHWVDKNDRSLGKVATVKANAKKATCCNKEMLPYRVALKGMTWPPMGHKGPVRLAITATGMKKATLPFFSFSANVMDSKFGKVQKVKGDFKLTMDSAEAKKLAEDPKAKTAFAKALATSTGLPADDINILAILLKIAGGSWTKVGARRLANSEVKVEYEILTASKAPIGDLTTPAITASLVAAVVKESKAIGVTVAAPTVVISAPVISSVGTDASCKDATCPMGQNAKVSAKDTMCSGGVDTCVPATCCEAAECGTTGVVCASGKFQDATKAKGSRGSDDGKTGCCTMKATCAKATCAAGAAANATASNTTCTGGPASCSQATCCQAAAPTVPPGTDGAIAMFLPSLSAIIAAAGSLLFF